MSEVRNILVIANDHDTRVRIRRILEDAGHFVVSATNGADALTLLDKITLPSLILLESRLHLMSGEDFMTALRKNSKYSEIPVAQIAAASDQNLQGACYLLKHPVDADDLLKAVETCK